MSHIIQAWKLCSELMVFVYCVKISTAGLEIEMRLLNVENPLTPRR